MINGSKHLRIPVVASLKDWLCYGGSGVIIIAATILVQLTSLNERGL